MIFWISITAFFTLLTTFINADPYCTRPTTPSHGFISEQTDKHTYEVLQDQVIFNCDMEYELIGSRFLICLPVGHNDTEWSDYIPECKLRTTRRGCSMVRHPKNGYVNLSRGLAVRSRATYSCKDGFELVGNEVRTCLPRSRQSSSLLWFGRQPFCKRNTVVLRTCGEPTSPVHGSVKQWRALTIGRVAIYSCKDGFKLEGDKVRTCQITGQWTGNQPVCEEITCETLTHPVNGHVHVTGRNAGSLAIYSCKPGFKGIVGERTARIGSGVIKRACQSDGQWSGAVPSCIRIECERLSDLSNGAINVIGLTVGSKAVYSCDNGFELIGIMERVCQSNGKWSGQEGYCRKTCGMLPAPRNGDVQVEGLSVGSKALYSCNSGFELYGNGYEERRCQSNGEWSGEMPSCTPKEITCEMLSDPTNGAVRMNAGVTVGSVAKYYCRRGFFLKGNSIRKCQSNGLWVDDQGNKLPPVCEEAVRCGKPRRPRGGFFRFRGKDRDIVGSVVKYFCHRNYKLRGHRFRKCQKNGKWSRTVPRCQRRNIVSQIFSKIGG